MKSPSFGCAEIDNSVAAASEINLGLNRLNLASAAENKSKSSSAIKSGSFRKKKANSTN